jgi:hypothetical protein
VNGAADPPRSARELTQRVDLYAQARGIPEKRARDWVSFMVLAGKLEEVGSAHDEPGFVVKGGVAVELRMREKARATRDLDIVVVGRGQDTVQTLRNALGGLYLDFSFRLRGEAHVMPNDTTRVEVVVEFKGRAWGTVRLDLSDHHPAEIEVEKVRALDLGEFGIFAPTELTCLSLRYQLAQKLHAMTEPHSLDRPNERFHDLVDVLLLRDLVKDLHSLRQACVKLFTVRATHAWPASFDPPAGWAAPFTAIARRVALDPAEFDAAVIELRDWIAAVAEAT